jgi:hypothetical protein
VRARELESARKDNKPRRAALSACERAAGCDLVKLLRDHERAQAAEARRTLPPDTAWADLVASIQEKYRDRRAAA